MKYARIGVLRGGSGYGYESSLSAGAQILKNIPAKYHTEDIFISKEGVWHYGGIPISLEKLSGKIDLLFNTLYGEYGEGGQLQKDLKRSYIDFVGSDMFQSALSMNKILTKDIAKKMEMKVPKAICLSSCKNCDVDKKAMDIFSTMFFPLLVKPINSTHSIGASYAGSYDELVVAIHKALRVSDSVLVEEYIKGREATCVVVDEFRSEKMYTFPVMEIVKPKNKKMFDYELKSDSENRYRCPGEFTKDEKEQMVKMARDMHKALGLKDYSQSDFIVSKDGVYFLETNSLPDFSKNSAFNGGLEAVGSAFPEFLEHILTLALVKK